MQVGYIVIIIIYSHFDHCNAINRTQTSEGTIYKYTNTNNNNNNNNTMILFKICFFECTR
jgi:hypothetical protein